MATGSAEEQRSSLFLERALPPVFASIVGTAILTRRVKYSGSSRRFAMALWMECGESDAVGQADTFLAAVYLLERAQ